MNLEICFKILIKAKKHAEKRAFYITFLSYGPDKFSKVSKCHLKFENQKSGSKCTYKTHGTHMVKRFEVRDN